MMKHQRGAALIVTLLAIALFVMALITGLRLLPLYQDDWTLQSVFAGIQEEATTEDLDRLEVQRRIDRRFIINNVDDLKEHVIIEGQGSSIRIKMHYERRVPLAANIELAATFTHNVIISE